MNPALDSRARFAKWLDSSSFDGAVTQAAWEAWQAAIASMAGWISVDERLPFVRVDVLIARGTGPSCERTIAFYDPDRYTPAWRYKDDPAEGIRGVTHWQPMPAPPTPQDPPIAAKAAKETI